MTFLNPLVLFGLIAAAIPVILHLLNLRKLRTIEFSTLTFLKELQQTKIRRLKLRQLLLLLIRTMLVIFIVVAFARPALHGTILGGFGSQAHSSIVFVLDDSFSMLASDEHGELLKQAKDAAGKLIDLMKDGDEAFLIKLSDLPQATIDPATHDLAVLRTAINECKLSEIRHPMDDALRLSASLLQKSRNANKEVYIISDMQRTLFTDNVRQHLDSALVLFDRTVNLYVVEVGSKPVANSCIDSLEVLTKILETGKPARIFASIRNFSATPLNDYVVSIFLDGVRAAQGNVSAAPWGSATVELSVTPKRSGVLKGYAESENDALEQDNRRYFALSIPSRIRIALVSASPNDVQFIRLAAQAGLTGGDQMLVEMQQVSARQFALLDLKNFDVLLISNMKSFSGADIDRITSFVTNGGGLILFPGPELERDNYNATLLPALHIPPIEGMTTSASQAPLTFQQVDRDHPLFATMFESDQHARSQTDHGIESPLVSTALKHLSGKQGRTIISLSDGSAFLSEYSFGDGKILFYSVAPVLSWSDFPLKGLFAPLMYRSLIYLTSRGAVAASYWTGDEPKVVAKGIREGNAHQYNVLSPDGTEEVIQPEARTQHVAGSAISFVLRRLTQAGFYEVRNGSKPLATIAVNVDPMESDTRIVSGDALEEFWKHLHISSASVHSVQTSGQLQAAVLQSRFGVELWKHCLLVALLLALLEMLVARDSRKASQQATE